MAEDIQGIIDYYTNLLIIQYHEQPNAQATIRALVSEAIASGIFFDIRDGYSIDAAVGVQLDVLGKYIGIDRFYRGQSFGTGFFALTPYNEATPPPTKLGLVTYSNWIPGLGPIITYDDILSAEFSLDDDNYRTLLRFKIIQNNINNSHQQIDDSLFEFFGTDVRASSAGNMVMFYFVPFALTQIMAVAIQKKVLPKPMGVRLDYYIPQSRPFFSCITYQNDQNPFNTGFTDYADFGTLEGETLEYENLQS